MKYEYSRLREGLTSAGAAGGKSSHSANRELRSSFSRTNTHFPSTSKLIYNYNSIHDCRTDSAKPNIKSDVKPEHRPTKLMNYRPIDESKALEEIEGLKLELSRLQDRKRARILKENGTIRVEQNYQRVRSKFREDNFRIAFTELQAQKEAFRWKGGVIDKQEQIRQLKQECQQKSQLIQQLADNIRYNQAEKKQLSQNAMLGLESKSKFQQANSLVAILKQELMKYKEELKKRQQQSQSVLAQLSALKLNSDKRVRSKQQQIANLSEKLKEANLMLSEQQNKMDQENNQLITELRQAQKYCDLTNRHLESNGQVIAGLEAANQKLLQDMSCLKQQHRQSVEQLQWQIQVLNQKMLKINTAADNQLHQEASVQISRLNRQCEQQQRQIRRLEDRLKKQAQRELTEESRCLQMEEEIRQLKQSLIKLVREKSESAQAQAAKMQMVIDQTNLVIEEQRRSCKLRLLEMDEANQALREQGRLLQQQAGELMAQLDRARGRQVLNQRQNQTKDVQMI